MRYFHRTSLSLGAVLHEADRFFGSRLTPASSAERRRGYQSALGQVEIEVQAEGGHYTLVTVRTDQVGESEVDRLAKRFLAVVHTRVEPDHELRGAY